MNTTKGGRVLLLALGNDLLRDDAVAFHAASAIEQLAIPGVDVERTGESGLALIELVTGYEQVVVVDALATGQHVPGTVITLRDVDLEAIPFPSPHYASLPDLRRIAVTANIPFPRDIRIVAMEVEDPYSVLEGLTPPVQAALPYLIGIIEQLLAREIEVVVTNEA